MSEANETIRAKRESKVSLELIQVEDMDTVPLSNHRYKILSNFIFKVLIEPLD